MRKAFRGLAGTPRRLGLALVGLLAVIIGTTASMASAASPGMSMNMSGSSSSSRAVVGDTLGWFAGHTSLLHYTKNYFCRVPPSSRASSNCEAGASFQKKPSNQFDPLYVIVPIGFTPREQTLQCPVAGNCVDHPHTIDLTRVLGAGTGNALLPAHSHIVTTAFNNKPEYWDVIVVGVTKSSSWYKIVQGKDLSTVRMLQKDKSNGVTPFIPTNLFLFFSVLPIR